MNRIAAGLFLTWFVCLAALPALGQNDQDQSDDQGLVRFDREDFPNLPVRVSHPNLGALDDAPVVAGGWTTVDDSLVWSEVAYRLDESTGEWAVIDGLRVPYGAAVVTVADQLNVDPVRSQAGHCVPFELWGGLRHEDRRVHAQRMGR